MQPSSCVCQGFAKDLRLASGFRGQELSERPSMPEGDTRSAPCLNIPFALHCRIGTLRLRGFRYAPMPRASQLFQNRVTVSGVGPEWAATQSGGLELVRLSKILSRVREIDSEMEARLAQ